MVLGRSPTIQDIDCSDRVSLQMFRKFIVFKLLEASDKKAEDRTKLSSTIDLSSGAVNSKNPPSLGKVINLDDVEDVEAPTGQEKEELQRHHAIWLVAEATKHAP